MKEYTERQLDRAAELENRLQLDIRSRLEGVRFRSAMDDTPVPLADDVMREVMHALAPITGELTLTIAELEG